MQPSGRRGAARASRSARRAAAPGCGRAAPSRAWWACGRRAAWPAPRGSRRAGAGPLGGLDERHPAQRAARVAALVAGGALGGDQALALVEAQRRRAPRRCARRARRWSVRVALDFNHNLKSYGASMPTSTTARIRRPAATCSTPLTGDEKHDPSANSTLDVLWVLYDRVLASTRRRSTTPTATGSCCPRATARRPTTRCSPPRASSRAEWLADSAALRLAARLPPRPQPGPRRRDLVRLARPRPAARASAWRSASRAGQDGAARRLPGRRRRARRGQQPRGDALAGRLGLDALTVVVVDNASSTYDWPGGIAPRFAVEGWAPRPSTAATTTRSSARSRPTGAAGRTWSSAEVQR